MNKASSKTITVVGAGYVGLPTAALFAHAGHKVYVLDINPTRLQAIKQGRSFFYEEGLDPLVAKAVSDGLLIPSNSYEECIPGSDLVFSCVGTPDNPDGSSNLQYVFDAAEKAAELMKPGTIYVQKSTVPVGTGSKVTDAMSRIKTNISYVSNPEFLREGTALSDSLFFDRVVVGGSDNKAVEAVTDIYKSVEAVRSEIAKLAGIKPTNNQGSYITTNLNSAELIKVNSNAFLALKISFANSIAKLADETGADINEVMDAVGADKRIGRAFLNAGRGYGGGCFPKDVSGLISSASEYGVDLAIMAAASDLNETMPGYIANKAQESLDGLKGKKVAVLGLAFKAGTSDARRSPGVKLANILAKNGAIVSAYDPEANKEAEEELRKGITIADSLAKAVKGADAVFIATEWPEFLEIDIKQLATQMRGKLFVDCMNAFNKTKVEQSGLSYIGVGRNGKP
ncbi:UDP-glucose/GDP-mannose dehydrogenase family protein [soil metagenome]